MWAHHDPGQEPALRRLIVRRGCGRRPSVIVITRLSAAIVCRRPLASWLRGHGWGTRVA